MPGEKGINNFFNQYFKQLGIYSITIILPAVLQLGYIPLFAHYFPPAEYGVIGLLLMTHGLLLLLFHCGFSYGAIKLIQDKQRPVGDIGFTLLLFITLWSGGLSAGFYFIADLGSAWLFHSDRFRQALQWTIVFSFLAALFQMQQELWRAESRVRAYTFGKVIYALGAFALSVVFLVLSENKIEGFWLARVVAAGGMVILNGIMSRQVQRGTFSREILASLWKYSFPLFASGLCVWLLSYVDVFMLARLVNLDQSGLYKMADELGLLVFALYLIFEKSWPQFIFSQWREADFEAKTNNLVNFFLSVYLLASLFFALFCPEIIGYLMPASYQGLLTILPISILGSFFYVLSQIFSAGILVTSKTYFIPLGTILAVIINIFLNFVLIPSYNILGAVIASLLANLVMVLFILIIAQHLHKIRYALGKTSLLVSLYIIFFGFAWGLNETAPIPFIVIRLSMLAVFIWVVDQLGMFPFYIFRKSTRAV